MWRMTKRTKEDGSLEQPRTYVLQILPGILYTFSPLARNFFVAPAAGVAAVIKMSDGTAYRNSVQYRTGTFECDSTLSNVANGNSIVSSNIVLNTISAITKNAKELPLPDMTPKRVLVLDGESLKTADLVDCEKGRCILKLSEESRDRIIKTRKLLETIVSEHRTVYGITTGFGTFSNVQVAPEQLQQLQVNLIRSHATAYGEPLTPSATRMLLALRINVLAKGYSGISLSNVEKMVAAFNAFCVSKVPQQGTVGCSGDLCQLAHLALGLLGEGEMWSPETDGSWS
uniref:Histidine ammonia-lyase n=1 Tax=Steinernema glaseri TaxID=37863 RepID=A0A1I8A2C5_9BILA